MSWTSQAAKAERFHDLHRGGDVLCLLNAWDAGSARVLEAEGAPAIGTTSAGIAYALGRADGEHLSRDELVEATARIAAAVDIPVSADVETGYGDTPAEVAETIAAVIEAGAIGVNIEDSTPGGRELRDVDDQCRRLSAAREAADATGVRLFVNGRTDCYWHGLDIEGDRLDVAVARLRAYAGAGADGAFTPFLADRRAIASIVDAVPVPLNVLATPDLPTGAELRAAGVKRVSTGSGPMRATLALSRRIAREALESGTFAAMTADAIPYAEANDLFA